MVSNTKSDEYSTLCQLLVMAASAPPAPPVTQHEDVFVDMQFAKPSCNDPILFAAEPWKYCTNILGCYLATRYERKEEFMNNLSPDVQSRIQHEIERIARIRLDLLSSEITRHRVLDFHAARQAWKQHRKDFYALRSNRFDPRNVRFWNLDADLDVETLLLNRPQNHDSGFKASALYFHKDEDNVYVGTTHSHPDLRGIFPDQRITVTNILADSTNNLLSQPCPSKHLRHFHLPATDLMWAEVCHHYDRRLLLYADTFN